MKYKIAGGFNNKQIMVLKSVFNKKGYKHSIEHNEDLNTFTLIVEADTVDEIIDVMESSRYRRNLDLGLYTIVPV